MPRRARASTEPGRATQGGFDLQEFGAGHLRLDAGEGMDFANRAGLKIDEKATS